MVYEILSTLICPIIVGIALRLFDRWLNDRDKRKKK